MTEPTLPARLEQIDLRYEGDSIDVESYRKAVALATLDAMEARLRDRMQPYAAYARSCAVVDEVRASLGVPQEGTRHEADASNTDDAVGDSHMGGDRDSPMGDAHARDLDGNSPVTEQSAPLPALRSPYDGEYLIRSVNQGEGGWIARVGDVSERGDSPDEALYELSCRMLNQAIAHSPAAMAALESAKDAQADPVERPAGTSEPITTPDRSSSPLPSLGEAPLTFTAADFAAHADRYAQRPAHDADTITERLLREAATMRATVDQQAEQLHIIRGDYNRAIEREERALSNLVDVADALAVRPTDADLERALKLSELAGAQNAEYYNPAHSPEHQRWQLAQALKSRRAARRLAHLTEGASHDANAMDPTGRTGAVPDRDRPADHGGNRRDAVPVVADLKAIGRQHPDERIRRGVEYLSERPISAADVARTHELFDGERGGSDDRRTMGANSEGAQHLAGDRADHGHGAGVPGDDADIAQVPVTLPPSPVPVNTTQALIAELRADCWRRRPPQSPRCGDGDRCDRCRAADALEGLMRVPQEGAEDEARSKAEDAGRQARHEGRTPSSHASSDAAQLPGTAVSRDGARGGGSADAGGDVHRRGKTEVTSDTATVTLIAELRANCWSVTSSPIGPVCGYCERCRAADALEGRASPVPPVTGETTTDEKNDQGSGRSPSVTLGSHGGVVEHSSSYDQCSSERKAAILIADVKAALDRGTTHYDKDGRRLYTVAAVIGTLLREGGVMLVEPPLEVNE